MDERICWNCRYGGSTDHLDDLAAGGNRCRCPIPGFPWHLYHRYGRFVHVMPHFCGHYEPQVMGRCPGCGAPLGPLHQIRYWANGVFTSLACCSAACLAKVQPGLDLEVDLIAPPTHGSQGGPVGSTLH